MAAKNRTVEVIICLGKCTETASDSCGMRKTPVRRQTPPPEQTYSSARRRFWKLVICCYREPVEVLEGQGWCGHEDGSRWTGVQQSSGCTGVYSGLREGLFYIFNCPLSELNGEPVSSSAVQNYTAKSGSPTSRLSWLQGECGSTYGRPQAVFSEGDTPPSQ